VQRTALVQEQVEDWFATPSLVMDLSSCDVCDWFGMDKAAFPMIALVACDFWQFLQRLCRVKLRSRKQDRPLKTDTTVFVIDLYVPS
jgi:hypothetical protein